MIIALISLIAAVVIFAAILIIDTIRDILWINRISKRVYERPQKLDEYEQANDLNSTNYE